MYWTQCDGSALQVTEMVRKARAKQDEDARLVREREEQVRSCFCATCPAPLPGLQEGGSSSWSVCFIGVYKLTELVI